jgi:hypothetical protein
MTNNQNNANNNNQNQQQGSLLRRVNNTTNNQNQQQNNQNNNNSFRSRLGQNNNSRFGNQNQNQQQNQPPPKPTWTITPMSEVGVRFAFQGIGDPLFRILGTPLDKSLKDVESFVNRLADETIQAQLVAKLDEAWTTYEFSGAAIFHPIRENILNAFTQPTMPVFVTDSQNNDNNPNNSSPNPFTPPNITAPYEVLRAVDPLFVLNVLGRVRGNVLVEETPVALEAGFLNQTYICDDPRLVELAFATGAIEGAW